MLHILCMITEHIAELYCSFWIWGAKRASFQPSFVICLQTWILVSSVFKRFHSCWNVQEFNSRCCWTRSGSWLLHLYPPTVCGGAYVGCCGLFPSWPLALLWIAGWAKQLYNDRSLLTWTPWCHLTNLRDNLNIYCWTWHGYTWMGTGCFTMIRLSVLQQSHIVSHQCSTYMVASSSASKLQTFFEQKQSNTKLYMSYISSF